MVENVRDATGSPKALIVDYGGVLTEPVADPFRRWAERAGVSYDEAQALFLGWFAATDSPIHALERGEITAAGFADEVAGRIRRIDGTALATDTLVIEMFGDMFSGDGSENGLAGMGRVLAKAKLAGIRIGLLSNSWGLDYNRKGWGDLFDSVVISGEVGMRKPDPDIYRYAADRLGVAPAGCVFVDDMRSNVRGAVAVGMIGVHHVDVATTMTELSALFRLEFTE